MDDATKTRSSDVPPIRAVESGRFAPGTVLADRYRIVSLAGRGGMGEVYRADDQRLGVTVALKFLPVQLENDLVARNRLIGEVRNARAISHPNVCRVYDIGEIDGRYFLTMEYIDGEDLASLLRRIERLPPTKALEVARQLCAGLAAAHDRGVLHRDLKPANIMIDGRGHARIADFGLAVDSAPGAAADGGGTFAYMAPEIFEFKPATVQSDLYALGLILYETYTGKRPFKASTIAEWQRAHSDSTPTHPSAIVAEIEPVVERVILRCLEKEPAKRPSSATQVAAALPGGDPLAAALAAGETPSPELVAASGEEGTMPRAQAWLWLGGCMSALVLAVYFASFWHLANLVPSRDPVLQVAEAQQILRSLGYTDPPADTAWWYGTDNAAMRVQVSRQPPSARFVVPTSPLQGALVFCYRQSSRPLFTVSAIGSVDALDPPPVRADDAYIELNPSGGLRILMIGGVTLRSFAITRPPHATGPMWPQLFAAAGLDLAAFTDTPPLLVPAFAFDSHVAWEGTSGNERIRVEAASHQGWPVEFRVLPGSLRAVPLTPYRRATLDRVLDPIVALLMLFMIAALAALAVRNLRAGRGDRKGARVVTIGMLVIQAIIVALARHWTTYVMDSLVAVMYCFGIAFTTAAMTWLSYLGLEPDVRRRWPHLLISWTRLLDGRWRDPLVGRSALAGVAYALVIGAIVPGLLSAATRWFDLPLALPAGQSQLGSFSTSVAALLADRMTLFAGVVVAWFATGVLLIARLITRNDRLAWVVLVLTFATVTTWSMLLLEPYTFAAPGGPILMAIGFSIGLALVLRRHGLLGCAVCTIVATALINTPVTSDFSSWYAWRTFAIAALVVAFSVWGFRNVLGRQTAFAPVE